ncbi:MAG: hypothetical protein SF187_23485 [Deltaproteobacteria bacterium]|nr:hypothetical protein [Deltaproteobacteria bacterium]
MKPKLKLMDSAAVPLEGDAAPGPEIVTLHKWTEEGPLIAPNHEGDPKLARWSNAIGRSALEKACADHAEALVVTTRDGVPIITALLAPKLAEASNESLDVHVDGRRVELVANEELTLRCGDACISLMKNGRVIVRGVQVETRAKGANRIRGGTVEIN